MESLKFKTTITSGVNNYFSHTDFIKNKKFKVYLFVTEA